MAKLKKGTALLCVPCGRRIVISSAGIASTTVWCCGRPMKSGSKTKPAAKKKAAAKKKKK